MTEQIQDRIAFRDNSIRCALKILISDKSRSVCCKSIKYTGLPGLAHGYLAPEAGVMMRDDYKKNEKIITPPGPTC